MTERKWVLVIVGAVIVAGLLVIGGLAMVGRQIVQVAKTVPDQTPLTEADKPELHHDLVHLVHPARTGRMRQEREA